ncbi:hypothetical protein BDZ89DRAFT_1057523 [Hymenopellis radicata]|nr:hypothetical protein BDZ89DRAFT_1057523 [Hymenopellis radicata]
MRANPRKRAVRSLHLHCIARSPLPAQYALQCKKLLRPIISIIAYVASGPSVLVVDVQNALTFETCVKESLGGDESPTEHHILMKR